MMNHSIIFLLTSKSIKSLSRQKNYLIFIILSLIISFGGFLAMFQLMDNQKIENLTSSPYSKLQFDYTCSPKGNLESASNIKCKPIQNDYEIESPSDVLLNWLKNGSPLDSTEKSGKHLLDLISSLMMNGLPLVGLDDFIHLSDLSNKYISRDFLNSIQRSTLMKNEFDNFFNARDKKIILTPESPCTREFFQYLNNKSSVFKNLKVEISPNMESALSKCCDHLWVIIEIDSIESGSECLLKPKSLYNNSIGEYFHINNFDFFTKVIPQVTIRMNPFSIPDTRNIEWSPLKKSTPRQQSGELLYFTSGFLTWQYEIQNFLRYKQFNSDSFELAAIKSFDDSIIKSKMSLLKITEAIMISNSSDALIESILQSGILSRNSKPSFYFPLYHRAYPTREYQQSFFWHLFGTILTIILVITFSFPTAISLGQFQKELVMGQIEVLSSFPRIRHFHSLISWCITSSFILLFYTIGSLVFFYSVLKFINPLIPVLALFLFGLSLVPLFALLNMILKSSDAIVFVVPILTFVSLLPGLIYFDSAFDIQRSFYIEIFLCLLPPSGISLILKLVFAHESLYMNSGFFSRAPISKSPIYFYLIMLIIDIVLYFIILYWVFNKLNPPIFYQNSIGNSFQQSNSSLPSFQGSTTMFSEFNVFSRLRSIFNQNQYQIIPDSVENESNVHLSFENDLSDINNNFDDLFKNEKIKISGLSKFRKIQGNIIPVLSDLSSNLNDNIVTVLLGSNGAGKTTLLKLLGGFDKNYHGSIIWDDNLKSNQRRIIGWCPQNDALFEYLSIREHLQLFYYLLTTNMSPSEIEAKITCDLEQLNLFEHENKYVYQLSGGMKRRLMLSLAFIGNPKILLLDEPTSGCDSHTRELIRKVILKASLKSTVLVSTHHADDIEILADRIWFLNERYLEIDKWAHQVLEENECLELLTNSHKIKEIFESKYPSSVNWRFDSSASQTKESAIQSWSWIVPPQSYQVLHSFLLFLESEKDLKNEIWNVEHPTLYKVLSNYYSKKSINTTVQQSKGLESIPKLQLTQNNNNASISMPFYLPILQFSAMIDLRFSELLSNLNFSLISQIIFPFLVVFIICIGCKDASYPKVELSSKAIDGIGDVIMSSPHAQLNNEFELFNGSNLLQNNQILTLLKYASPGTLDWFSYPINSDTLWSNLFDEYYNHSENRWGSLIYQDEIPEWIESSITLSFNSIKLKPLDLYNDFIILQDRICSNYTDLYPSKNSEHLNATHFFNNLHSISFCDPNHPAFSIKFQLSNISKSHNSKNGSTPEDSIKITNYYNLHTNFTLMTNVSVDHAAPIFFKEVFFPVHDYLQNNQTIENPIYTLSSHPFPINNVINKVFLERGFLGAMVITLYLMICTVTSVRFIALCRHLLIKRQLHIAGLYPSIFWSSNFLFDVFIIFLNFFSIYLAIKIGGSPIREYFFNSQTELNFILNLFLYATASISSGYMLTVLSEDELTSQLFMLLSTLGGGIFLKMYLERHHGSPYDIISQILDCISPTFAFTTIMFDSFKLHANTLLSTQTNNSKIRNEMDLCQMILFFQTLFYFALTMLIDFNILSVLSKYLKFRWYFSSESFIFQQTSAAKLKIYLDQPSYTETFDSSHPLWQDLNKSDLHPDLNTGIFPILLVSNNSILEEKDQSLDICFKPNLNINDLTVGYITPKRLSLSKVNLNINPGERLAILGMNGGGKTTLFETCCLINKVPFNGSISIGNLGDEITNIWKLGPENLIGYVPQEGGLANFLTTEETINIFSKIKGIKPLFGSNYSLDSPFLPKKYLNYPVQILSGGTKKKLAITIANLCSPKLLFLDECTTGVDPISSEMIVDYLSQRRDSNQSILFSSHRIDELVSICSRAILLMDGRIVLDIPMKTFQTLVTHYYQVDIQLSDCKSILNEVNNMGLNSDIFVKNYLSGINYNRIVIYSSATIRLSLNRAQVPMSEFWNKLHQYKIDGLIAKYSFRSMEMEEVLASLIENLSST